MRTVLVRYTVKPECLADNERLIAQVFQELARDKPSGMRYQVFKLEGERSFTHIAATQSEENPLHKVQAFKEFTAGIKERCEVGPEVVKVETLGAYLGF